MASGDDFKFPNGEKTGTVRLFPLPNLVLFPHVLQPLRVFEERYVEMFEAAISTDYLIAMALLEPGFEQNYEGRPAIFPVGCVGRIATHASMEDGTYNFLLQGLQRVRFEEELEPKWSYREARASVLDDVYPLETSAQRPALRKELIERFKAMLPASGGAQEKFDDLLGSEISLGALTDIVGYTVDVPLNVKQKLIAETNVDTRAGILLDQLGQRQSARSRPPFPPEFSDN